MNVIPSLEQIKAELAWPEMVLHGSILTDRFTPRSDIDVAVITRPLTGRRT